MAKTIPNRNSPPAILLREGWREGNKTRKRTLANLSHWPAHKIEALRRLLRNKTLVAATDVFHIERTLPHGHVAAIPGTIRKLGLDSVISARHSAETRVPAHIFLCMLAYYVEWHMRRALAPLLFEDEEAEKNRKRRDPILPAKPSESADSKKQTHRTTDGLAVHDFTSLISELAARSRVTYKLPSQDVDSTFQQVPESAPLQRRAYELLGLLPVSGK